MHAPLHHVAVLVAAAALALAACGDDGSGATASFTAPDDGSVLAGGVDVAMVADGITIEEAGEVRDDAGHFHVIADDGCVETGDSIPKDADHVHFGGGQTESVIYLAPGSHELCLQVGNGEHAALEVTDTIAVEVAVENRDDWCSVIEQVDDLLASTEFVDGDASGDFAGQQTIAANARRLLAQLEAGTEFVDADASDDVAELVSFGVTFTTAIADASDAESAEESLMGLYDGINGESLPGADWVLEACGVDVEG